MLRINQPARQSLREPLKEITEIERLRSRAENKRGQWLRNRGWEYTSSTPGCYWMYRKEWEGKVFLVDEPTAARIQEHWDREKDYELHPEDYEE
jgi:hypothetical protein